MNTEGAIVMSQDNDENDVHRWDLPLDSHPRLELEMSFARLDVVPLERGESAYLEVSGRDASSYDVEIETSGRTTHVEIGGSVLGESWWGAKWWEAGFWDRRGKKKGQRARMVLHVPENLVGRIRSSAAKMTITGLFGCDLEVETDAGQIVLDDVAGRLAVRADAGKIEGRKLRGTLDVEADMGAVELEIDALDPGRHKISADMGSVKVQLAQGMPVRIEAQTDMGATRVDFPTTDDAEATLVVETDLGAVRVEASKHVWREHAAKTSEAEARSASELAPSYRTNDILTAAPDAEVSAVLERVASGALSPADAKEILRAMGWS